MSTQGGPVIDRELVYGVHRGSLVFIPTARATELALLRDAIGSSSTWGELRMRLSPEQFREVFEVAGYDEYLSFEEYCEDAGGTERGLNPDATRCAYRARPPDQKQPEDEDPFDVGNIGAFCDGDWPAWPEQEMLWCLPKHIQVRFGTVRDSVHNGYFLILDPNTEVEIVAALQADGYRCSKDADLVRRACP